MVAVLPPKQLGKPLGTSLRVLPPHLVNLGGADVAHRGDMAVGSDGHEILGSAEDWVDPRKLREQLPLSVWNGEPVDSGLLTGGCFLRATY